MYSFAATNGLEKFGFSSPGVIEKGFRVVVQPWQQAIVIRDGKLIGEYGAGRYRRTSRSSWYLVDTRSTTALVPAQEILTADGVQIRLTLAVSYRISEAKQWILNSATPLEAIYNSIQIKVRDRLAAVEFAQLTANREVLLKGLSEELAAEFIAFGAVIEKVELKDFYLPAEVRQVLSEAALAKHRGLAELEKARSQAAALRSLANTAKLVKDNPELLKLQEIQAVGLGGQLIIHRGVES